MVMIMKIRELFYKYQEQIRYLFWGAATTSVNYCVYFLSTRALQMAVVPANTLAWLISVLFAFWVNKSFVFASKSWKWSVAAPELFKFAGGRVFSGLLEIGILWLCVDIMHLHDGVIKLLASVLVVILNYVFSKLFIFRGGNKNG